MLTYKPHVFIAQNSDHSFDLHLVVSVPEDRTLKRHSPRVYNSLTYLRYETIPFSYEPDMPPIMFQTVETITKSSKEQTGVVVQIIEWSSQSEGYQILGEITLDFPTNSDSRGLLKLNGHKDNPDGGDPDPTGGG